MTQLNMIKPSREEAIAELEREKMLRKRVYANRIMTKRLSRRAADRQMARLQAAIDYLTEDGQPIRSC